MKAVFGVRGEGRGEGGQADCDDVKKRPVSWILSHAYVAR